ncbi:MAG: tripartite tricarboxylate transporter TctB family protein [Bosea sp. (in: a-proteobacteria)]
MPADIGGGGKPDRAGIVAGLGLFGLAGALWYEGIAITRTVTYGVGPTASLKIVAIGLALLGLMTLINAFRHKAEELEPINAGPVWIILGACLMMILCVRIGVGFIPAMTVLFAATSFAFGRRNIPADLAIGFGLSLGIYLLFTKLLTLGLPQGPLERLIG